MVWKWMKRFVCWIAAIIVVAFSVVLIGGLSIVGYYEYIVGQTPGKLPVPITPTELGSKVNVFAGTGGVPYLSAYETPAATTPFGMVRLGPDTASIIRNVTGLNASGYYYGDNKIIGFSHTRLVGADAREGGNFRISPKSSEDIVSYFLSRTDRFSRFSHKEECGFPGYYAVRLPEEAVLAELTATPRVGVHRYTFDKDAVPHLLLDVSSALGDRNGKDGLLTINPEQQEVTGQVTNFGSFSGRYGGLTVYFVAQFNHPFSSYGIWTDHLYAPGVATTSGNAIGADLGFDAPQIEVRLALSYVSIQNARENLVAEAAGKSFDSLAMAAGQAWEDRLRTIRIQSDNEEQQRIFYTALYHSMQMPSVFSDANSEYLGFDKALHRAEDFHYYTDFSLWDTFRNVHSLYTMIAPEEQRDMMRSLLAMAQTGGAFPRWPAGGGYTNCMLGTPADIAVTEAYLKGVDDFDIEAAYALLRRTAMDGPPEESRFAGRKENDAYWELGYCPSDTMSKAVSATLEYAHADHALSLLAAALGHEKDAKRFADQAQSYRNLWDPERQYFVPKNQQGVFTDDFDPLVLSYTEPEPQIYTDDYVEGTALQWRWYVPQDPEGLIALFESKDYFIEELTAFFEGSNPYKGWWHPGSYYWHGNEPDIHAAYLFNAAGRPDLTQYWVRYLLENKYGDDPVALDGNDDAGTLSAWYVFSALGFYPVPGTTRYELAAPLVEHAEVRVGDHTLTITTENYAPDHRYARRIWLNEVLLERSWITHDEIAGGATLRFEMSATP